MTDDLIERLRSVDVSWSETGEWCAEAADRIETQAREIERLREALGLADAALRGANMNMNVVERKLRAELVADVFAYLIARSQEPEEFLPGSYVKRLHADERTAWLEKMREEYNDGDI